MRRRICVGFRPLDVNCVSAIGAKDVFRSTLERNRGSTIRASSADNAGHRETECCRPRAKLLSPACTTKCGMARFVNWLLTNNPKFLQNPRERHVNSMELTRRQRGHVQAFLSQLCRMAQLRLPGIPAKLPRFDGTKVASELTRCELRKVRA